MGPTLSPSTPELAVASTLPSALATTFALENTCWLVEPAFAEMPVPAEASDSYSLLLARSR